MQSTKSEENQADYSHKWYVLISMGMGVFLATIYANIVNIALPTLVKTFNTKFAVVQWVPLSYMLIIATLILSMGRLGDLIPEYRFKIMLFLMMSNVGTPYTL